MVAKQANKMARPDFAAAKRYALARLERELPPELHYHDFEHTLKYVIPAAERLAQAEGINGEERELLSVAAHYHDLGYLIDRDTHEAAGTRIVSEVLPRFDFSAAQIKVIKNLILATKMPQTPATHLEQILADADLDVLGTIEFFPTSVKLRKEQAVFGHEEDDLTWYRNQLEFLQNHEYFTTSAKKFRDAGKRANMRKLKDIIQELESNHK
ncbi:MAG: HD domain-containing protein [Anaerolineales bacterium]|nr:HD domain-containing protein [Anaerolineales bacterium]